MKRRIGILIPAVVFGIWTSLIYVNPQGKSIEISEIILQLSGSRGDYVLQCTFNELMGFGMRLLPSLFFEAVIGMSLYRHFCTASVYVFSRIKNRLTWYTKEILEIALLTVTYQVILIIMCVLITQLRYDVILDGDGIILCLFHFLIHSMWMLIMTVLVNLIAIIKGSSVAFALVAGFQTICIASLTITNTGLTAKGQTLLLDVNPVTYLILGWHKSEISATHGNAIETYSKLYIEEAALILASILVIVLIVGAIKIRHYDMLISDSERGE